MDITMILVLCCAFLCTATDIATPQPDGLFTARLPARRAHRICPLPECSSVPSVESLRAPGLGIALEMGYGTAVVRHHNGSYQSIIRIDGDDDYLSTMYELSTGPKERPPYAGDSDAPGSGKKWAIRLIRKAIGWPATSTTAVLANMVKQLHAAAEANLNQKIAGCVISSPDHIQFKFDEVADILDYLQLHNVNWGEQLGAVSAAYAGMGEGLCPDYIDYFACEWFEDELPYRRTLHLDLNPASLSGTIKLLTRLRGPHPDHSFVSPELGFQSSVGAPYWTALGDRIRKFVQVIPDGQHITYLILTGTSASNGKFKSVVRDSLYDIVTGNSQAARLLSEDEPTIPDETDLIFLTARGAAEIAKRRQEGPYECRDTKKGAQRRRDQRPPAHEEGTASMQKHDL